MSATYQQRSKLIAETAEKDPQNIYYTRGPKVRLSAEQVRDQVYVYRRVISNKMYGPGVMPYQPMASGCRPGMAHRGCRVRVKINIDALFILTGNVRRPIHRC